MTGGEGRGGKGRGGEERGGEGTHHNGPAGSMHLCIHNVI